jgi:Domain of unknown function DUF29
MIFKIVKALKTTAYDEDLALWLEHTIADLKANNLSVLDIEHLVEELEGLAGRDKRALKGHLRSLLEHALKRRYTNSPYDYHGWEGTLRREQIHLNDILKQSPSLKHYGTEVFSEVYEDALRLTSKDYPDDHFPAACPFPADFEQLLVDEFWQI